MMWMDTVGKMYNCLPVREIPVIRAEFIIL